VYTGVYLAVAFLYMHEWSYFWPLQGASVFFLHVSGWAFAGRGMALTGSVVWCDVLCLRRSGGIRAYCACGDAEVDASVMCLRRSR
jgi:hypothetical protein